MNGTVFLTGAGPGDPGLVTDRARMVLRAADVIVYDALASRDLLRLAAPSCDLIDAGKRAGEHTLSQDQINKLLVQRAQQGQVVVRLKGGDPFVFGRGGEEALACRKANIPFEVVPGITSGVAAPAFAGIPVTHRGVAQHVTFVTASGGAEGTEDPDYSWLAQSDGTVVLFMGLRRLEHVAEQLLSHGAAAATPVAVISNGSTPLQQTVTGTLADIGGLARGAGLPGPAVIVVGDVVNLREQLEWFERRPLFGHRVAVTRARAQASDLVAALRELGAAVVECPLIRIEPLPTSDLDLAIDDLEVLDFVIFTSRNGAAIFFERLAARGCDARTLHRVRICAVGSGTAEVCTDNGIIPDVVPPPGKRTGEGLLEALSSQPLYSAQVLLVRAETGDERLVQGLRDNGAHLRVAAAYRTVIEVPDSSKIAQALGSDVVTFASASTVENFSRLVPEGVPRPPCITIGPVTTAAAREHGFVVAAEAAEPSVGSMVVSVLEHAQRGSRP